MLRKNSNKIKKAMMDGLHDCEDTFNLCKKLEIEPAIKIRDNASEKGLSSRANKVRKYKKKGYKRWAKEKEYGEVIRLEIHMRRQKSSSGLISR